jgi:two-component system, cell cycle sensor histidine kinase and response regulator CckA
VAQDDDPPPAAGLATLSLEAASSEPLLDREHANRALQQSDARYQLLFASTPVPAWMVDYTTLRFLEVNDAMTTVHGYSREELLQMTVLDLKLPEDVADTIENIRITRGATVNHVGVRRMRRKDGSLVELDITGHQITFDDRPCVLAIGVDVTQARRIDEQLRHAQKMDAIGRLAGGIAHDFNNIVAVILSNAELALEEIVDDAGRSELHEIIAAAHRASALTRQLLAFSRKHPRAVKALSLPGLIGGLGRMLRRIVGEDIEIVMQLAADSAGIAADISQIEQLVMNLVVNARDAMPTGGRLVLKTDEVALEADHAARLGVAPGAFVRLTVSDTGRGMEAATRERIFEPFFTTKAPGKGTGLGLATVFGIVEQSSGAIEVESAPGRGTTFRVLFPRVALATEPTAPAAIPLRKIRGAGTILIVEDDHQLRCVLRDRVRMWGYHVLEAHDPSEALALAHAWRGSIELLLTDLVMPEMDGRTLAGEIHRLRPATRVLYMSGFTEHATVQTRLDPGDAFLEKPFAAELLWEAIQRVLGTNRCEPGASGSAHGG